MPTYIAFLRAVNVGGKNAVPMADLRTMFAELGFDGAKTLLQSGNVVFEGKKQSDSKIEEMLEKATEIKFGLKIDYMIRSAAELVQFVDENPFKREAKSDPGHLLALFLKKPAPKGAEEMLKQAIKGREQIRVFGNNAIAVYRDGVGTSKLTNTVLEKHLGTRATGRNWNTVNKLLQIASELDN